MEEDTFHDWRMDSGLTEQIDDEHALEYPSIPVDVMWPQWEKRSENSYHHQQRRWDIHDPVMVREWNEQSDSGVLWVRPWRLERVALEHYRHWP
jgi:hypothetical protein